MTKPLTVRFRPIKLSKVSFATLERYLLDLGFKVKREPKGWNLSHKKTGIEYRFGLYEPDDKVSYIDLANVQHYLEWHELSPPLSLEDRLLKVPA